MKQAAIHVAMPPGPGWFDSSLELATGLDVREGWPPDAPLLPWLEAFLGQRAALTASASSTTASA